MPWRSWRCAVMGPGCEPSRPGCVVSSTRSCEETGHMPSVLAQENVVPSASFASANQMGTRCAQQRQNQSIAKCPTGKISMGHDDRESGSCRLRWGVQSGPRCNAQALHKPRMPAGIALRRHAARHVPHMARARCRESETHLSGTGEAHAPLCLEAHPL